MTDIFAAQHWATNGWMIADCAKLGYIKGRVLDPTYGRGTWWSVFRPPGLVASDLDPSGGAQAFVDFRALPHEDNTFDTVAYDPPYKYNGTPTPAVDDRYGVGESEKWRDRWELICEGFIECARVLKSGGRLLAKCQDQVCSGQVRWQSHGLVDLGLYGLGLTLVDELIYLGGRPQPPGRRQVHARRNYSNLLVFSK